MLKEVYISTSGGTASGSQSTNATAGTVTTTSASATARRRQGRHERHKQHHVLERGHDRGGFRAQSGQQFDRGERQVERVDRRRRVDREGNDDPAVRDCVVRTRQYAARV